MQTFSEINGDCPRHEEGHIEQRIDCWMSLCFLFFYAFFLSLRMFIADWLQGQIYVVLKSTRNVWIYHQRLWRSLHTHTHIHTFRVKERHLQLLNVTHALALLPYSVDGGLNDP